MNILKNSITAAVGLVGSAAASVFGGWDSALTTLIIFMGIDYLTGLVVAGVFKNSPKTSGGALESRAGLKGLLRKCMTLVAVLVAYRLDTVAGSDFIGSAAVIAFIANETISITENAGLMGVPLPDVMVKAIEILKTRSDADEAFGDRNDKGGSV